MSEKAYLDFDLRIRRVDGKFSARVLNSPAGEAKIEFSLPFSELELENFLLRVGRPRRGVRRLESPEMEAARIIGGQLFNTVFDDEVRSCLRRSLDEAARRDQGLRIRLRLDDSELADIPWEYLYDTALDRFLSLSKETPIVRYLDLPQRIHPLPVEPPLRVLVMISSPSDYPTLDVEREWAKLQEAIGELEVQGLLELERLEEATLSALQQQLRRGEYHIFHFVGHGTFDERSQDGVLLLESETGRGRPVSGRDLGTILHDHRSLRLALLNACEGARAARSDPFAGVAHSLVQQRLPAVIAMQFEITDEAAITLAHGFYAALADGYPVDAALAEARKAIFAQENDVEWGTPVLYLCTPDGRVFDIDRISDTERKERQISALLLEAQAATAIQDWPTAMAKLQSVVALDPIHDEATSRLKSIKQQQQLSGLYSRGLKHYQADRWREANEYFQQVQSIDAGYKEVNTLLAAIASQMAQEQAEAPLPKPTSAKPFDRRWMAIAAAVALVLLLCGGGYVLIKWSGPAIVFNPTPLPETISVGTVMPQPDEELSTPSTSTPTKPPTETASPTPTVKSPTSTPVPPTTVPQPAFGSPSFCLENEVDKQNRRCPVSRSLFSGLVETIYVSWPHQNVYKNMKFERKWFRNGQQIYSKASTWDDVDWKLDTETEYTYLDAEGLWGQPYFPSGDYTLELYIEGILEQTGRFTVDQAGGSLMSAEEAVEDYFTLVGQKQYETTWKMAKYYTKALDPPTFANYSYEWENTMGKPTIQGAIDAQESGNTATVLVNLYLSKPGKTYQIRYTLERDYDRGDSRFGYWIFTAGDILD